MGGGDAPTLTGFYNLPSNLSRLPQFSIEKEYVCNALFFVIVYNVCCCFRFTVYHDYIRKVTLSGNNNETIAGRARVSLVEEPKVEEIAFGEKTITMLAPDGECFKPGVNYYLVVYPTTFSSGMTLTYYTEDASASYVYSKAYTLGRSKSVRFSERDKDLTFSSSSSEGWGNGGNISGGI